MTRRWFGMAVFGVGCAMTLVAGPTTQVRLHGDVQRPTTRGRWVSNLTGLEIFSVGEPGSVALMFFGLLAIVLLGRRPGGARSIGA